MLNLIHLSQTDGLGESVEHQHGNVDEILIFVTTLRVLAAKESRIHGDRSRRKTRRARQKDIFLGRAIREFPVTSKDIFVGHAIRRFRGGQTTFSVWPSDAAPLPKKMDGL